MIETTSGTSNIDESSVLKIIFKTKHLLIVKSLCVNTSKQRIYLTSNKRFLKIQIENLEVGDIYYKQQETIKLLYRISSKQNVLIITNKCNYACISCPQEDNLSDKNLEVINEFIIKNISIKSKFIALSGGEPTLNKERFLDILKSLSNYSFEQIDILTNGTGFNDFNFVQKIAKVVDKKRTVFAISLYSDTDDIQSNITRDNSFYKVLTGLHNLAKFKFKIEIRIVISKFNFNRLPQIADFISLNFPFVYHVAFMGLEFEAMAFKNQEEIWIDPQQYQRQQLEAARRLDHAGIRFSLYNQQLCYQPKVLWKFNAKSISDWKRIYLPECSDCIIKDLCGGFFKSNLNIHSNFINPIWSLE